MSTTPESLEAALGQAFTPEAPAPVASKQGRAPEPDEIEIPEDPADLASALPAEEVPEAEAKPEPDLEIDLPSGEKVVGKERIRELAERGLKAGRGFEENARVREALQAHQQQAQMYQQFQQAAAPDMAALQAIEGQLRAFEKVDWSREYDNDFVGAAKLKEQRDQLREQRAAAMNNLNAKQQQFQAHYRENAQRILAAENEALLAKVPAWRNAEKAKQEQGEIARILTNHYGYTPSEVGTLVDHRALLVARDAAAYRALLANKDARVKQAREAPATAKPGAAAQPNSRADFNKAKGLLKAHGAKGNHRAQEDIAAAMFEKAFK